MFQARRACECCNSLTAETEVPCGQRVEHAAALEMREAGTGTLAMKIGPLDENGLDVLFAIGCDNYKKENVKGFDIPSTFRSAMELAEAPDEKDMYQTPMAQALLPILATYRSDMSKKLTIIVLTTGEWEGQPDD